MARRIHLFVALNGAAFGELGHGMRIAEDLHAAGDGAVFFAPQSTALLFRDTAFGHVPVDGLEPSLAEVLPRMVREESVASVVLIDVVAVVATLETLWAIDPGFLHNLGVPVIALDNWSIWETDLKWDGGTDFLAISPKVLEFPKRLVPVPFARPLRGVAYNALPPRGPLSESERQAVRSDFGIPAGDKLVLLLSGKWQTPAQQLWKHHRRVARQLPHLVFQALAALGPQVRVVHVGPERFEGGEAIGERYHWLSQLAPERFKGLMGTADLHLSLNVSATSMASAVTMGVPMLLLVNSHEGRTTEEVLAALPGAPEAVHRWLDQVVPLRRFRVWPIGLYDVLTPVLADNPYATTFETVEALDWDSLVETCRRLLFDPAARAALLERQAAYCAMVRGLPTPGDLFRSYL
jgi:hypothetical protein